MQVFVRGDKKVEYEKVIEIIAILKQYSKIDKVGQPYLFCYIA